MTKKYKKKVFSRHFVRILILVALAIGFSFFGTSGWFFELFTHFVFQYLIILVFLAICLLFSRRYLWMFVAISLAFTQIFNLLPMWRKPTTVASRLMNSKVDHVCIMQYNVDRKNEHVNDIAKWIVDHAEEVDILVLFEVTDKWQVAIERVKWLYPYHITQEVRGGRSVIVLSKLLVDELEIQKINQENSAIVIRGSTLDNDIPFVLYAIHPESPTLPAKAKSRNNYVLAASKSIAKEKFLHKILLGDFNMTRFSPYLKEAEKISGLRDSSEGTGWHSSWPAFLPKIFNIPIDGMLISDWIISDSKQTGPAIGSDHYPVITNLSFVVPGKGE